MEDLSPTLIATLLRTCAYGRSLKVLAETGSTNDDCQAAGRAGAPNGHTIVADCQKSGRGSHGRTWSSTAHTDLYLSILDRPAVAPAALPPLTLAVGLGLADTVAALLPDRRVEIKWPNDLWVDRKKCAGVLLEGNTIGEHLGALAIGIGLNVNRIAFPPDLKSATSLRLSGGRSLNRAQVLAELLYNVERWVQVFITRGPSAIAAALCPRLALRGHLVQAEGVRGLVLGVAESGALRIKTADGERSIVSGRIEEVERP